MFNFVFNPSFQHSYSTQRKRQPYALSAGPDQCACLPGIEEYVILWSDNIFISIIQLCTFYAHIWLLRHASQFEWLNWQRKSFVIHAYHSNGTRPLTCSDWLTKQKVPTCAYVWSFGFPVQSFWPSLKRVQFPNRVHWRIRHCWWEKEALWWEKVQVLFRDHLCIDSIASH